MTAMTAVETGMVITEPGVYDIPAADYHRDPVPGGSLSSTGARRLLEPGGPAKYRYAVDHPGEEVTDAFDFGKAAHQVVLGDPEDRMMVVNALDWRSKDARQQRDDARAAGLTPVLVEQWQQVLAMAAAIEDHPTAAGLLHSASGKPEQTLAWRDRETGVWCRARIDWLRTRVAGRRLLVVDYKSARAADTEAFGKSSADYGYFVQAAFYLAGIRALQLDADPAFLFVVQDKQAPYLVNVVELDDTALSLGRNLTRHALKTYADCTRTGQWPGYGTEVQLASLPHWFLKQYDEV